MAGRVEMAVREIARSGIELRTASRGSRFSIQPERDRLVLRLGKTGSPAYLPWAAMEDIPAFLASKGEWVFVGGQRDAGDPTTLDGFLKRFTKTDTARWVAALLGHTGLIDIRTVPRLEIRARGVTT